jgi:hypothetical protein
VALFEVPSEFSGNEGGKPNAFAAEEAASEFGIKDLLGDKSDLSKTGQVLVGSMQNPLMWSKKCCESRQIGKGYRVDEPGSATVAIQLNEIGALSVAKTRRTLSIHPQRSAACRKALNDTTDTPRRFDDLRDTLAGF